ncbi:MAG: M23 family metallopeptidase [Anaerolineales bacterium]|nr:M23 family metallopeptidase [Anaerolineales bacterium]MCB9127892.1 M23 family metallopeptidase [Ardenticatenales bacterium]MCB9171654.1 M23 family metallopeptidase [Ardenticatenales bacterium]
MRRHAPQTRIYKGTTTPKSRSFATAWLVVLLLLLVGSGMSAGALSVFREAPPPPTATASPTPPTATVRPSATALPTATASPTPWPTPLLSLSLEPAVALQGETLVLRATLDRAATLDGDFEGRPIPFFYESPTAAWALLAVSADASLGPRTVAVVATAPDGAVTSVSQPIEVQAAGFGAQRIPVSGELSLLLLPEVRSVEEQYLADRMGQSTTEVNWEGPFGIPTQGNVTSPFGASRAYADGPITTYHGGIDFAAPQGTGVFAAAAGRVLLAEALTVRGNTVVIDHGMGVFTLYAHLAQSDVAVGQELARGDWIGTVGNTGLSTGPHLHWEVRINGRVVNPSDWLSDSYP